MNWRKAIAGGLATAYLCHYFGVRGTWLDFVCLAASIAAFGWWVATPGRCQCALCSFFHDAPTKEPK